MFRIDVDGQFTTVYTFPDGPDGGRLSELFPGPSGTIYGFARVDQTDPRYRVFVIGADGTVTPDAFRMAAEPKAVGADGAIYGLSHDPGCVGSVIVRRELSGVEVPIAGFPSPTCQIGFIDVLPLAGGGVVALATRSVDFVCEVWHIVPGPARMTQELAGSCWGRPFVRRLRDDGAGGALGFTDSSVFRVGASGVVTLLTRVPSADGTLPTRVSGLDRLADGTVWAVGDTGATFNGGGVFAIPAAGPPALVAAFAGGNHEGRDPTGSVVADADGFLYGVTSTGGDYGGGTIYRVTRTGSRFDVLYAFTGRGDGRSPTGLVQTADGAMYGTTSGGNVNVQDGTVFRVARSGALTTLFVFRRVEDGLEPGALTVGGDGLLYGRTRFGGLHGWGTAFRLSPRGEMVVLYHFPRQSDELPAVSPSNSRFTLGRDGQFYAVTRPCNDYTCGRASVFRMNATGQMTLLWVTPPMVVVNPGLLPGADGRLWGSFLTGVFVLTPSGTVTEIPLGVGAGTIGGLKLMTDDGNLLGVTSRSVGVSYAASLFHMTPQGRVRELGTIRDTETLLDGRDGFIYGTGPREYPVTDMGAVFRLAAPGPPAPSGVRILR